MTKVRLEILPSLAGLFDSRGAGRLIFKKEIGEDTTVGDLLKKLGTILNEGNTILILPVVEGG